MRLVINGIVSKCINTTINLIIYNITYIQTGDNAVHKIKHFGLKLTDCEHIYRTILRNKMDQKKLHV